MKKLILIPAFLASLFIFAGCTGPNQSVSKPLFVTTVSTGVAFGVERYPQATPYLRIAAPIICAAGDGTDLSTTNLINAIKNSPAAEAVATPEGKLILNGALVLYISLFDAYGNDYVNQNAQLKQYLQWTCEAINLGLPANINLHPSVLGSSPPRKSLPPHL